MLAPILIVDDAVDICRVIELALTEGGYPTACAHDGTTAVAWLAQQAPSLLLLDLHLPDMTGWHLLQHLRAQHRHVPVVIMTAGHSTRLEAARHGAAGYLAKPFDLETLYTAVAALLSTPGTATAVDMPRAAGTSPSCSSPG